MLQIDFLLKNIFQEYFHRIRKFTRDKRKKKMTNRKISELVPLSVVNEDLTKTFMAVTVDLSDDLTIPEGFRTKTTRKVTLQQINDAIEASIPITAFNQASFNTANAVFALANTLSSLVTAAFETANLAYERSFSSSFLNIVSSNSIIDSNYSMPVGVTAVSYGTITINPSVTFEISQGSLWIIENAYQL